MDKILPQRFVKFIRKSLLFLWMIVTLKLALIVGILG
uniref:Macaca fascicularis brain cDNA clone: QorA-12416, similar to human hypothetical protein MGC33887 (MGC33887), mRNA, RefSeq: NM_145036.1 n=2 Tax=Macaca TaxID=9539 RepID=I7GLA3_MACFA|nr:unnamed protein product [Macaca fascicularis]